jgi:putative ABC transport system permease protein
MNNLRFALRQLRKSPGFTAVAVLTLALGIGANTAIFSVVNAVLLRPLPYPQADRLVYLNEVIQGTDTAIALPDYVDWRRDNTSFQHLALTRLESLHLSDVPGRAPERISVSLATANFFDTIGLKPQLGRTYTEDEDKPGAPPLAVISDRLWDRAFHRDPQIVGRAITLHGRPVTVIGVMPREMNSPPGVDIWLSLMRRSANPAWQNRANHPMFYGWGRLKDGVTIEQARSEMIAIAARLEKVYPATNSGVGVAVRPLLEKLLGNYRTSLALLLAAVGVVLLIACANLANLLAARGAARAREFAIRAAIGAGRGQIIRHVLIESVARPVWRARLHCVSAAARNRRAPRARRHSATCAWAGPRPWSSPLRGRVRPWQRRGSRLRGSYSRLPVRRQSAGRADISRRRTHPVSRHYPGSVASGATRLPGQSDRRPPS